MRVRRLLSVVAVAALAVSALAACQTNVGAAAFVGKTRISESDVNKYLTPQSALQTNSDATTTNPKSVVLSVLIQEQLYSEEVVKLLGHAPTASALSDARVKVLANNGTTEDSLAAQIVASAYSRSLVDVYLDGESKFEIIVDQLKATQLTQVSDAIAKLKLRVRVNPRYGSWDPASLAVSNGPAVPSYLQLLSGASASPAATTAG